MEVREKILVSTWGDLWLSEGKREETRTARRRSNVLGMSKMERQFFPRREVSSLLSPEGILAGWRKRKCLKVERREPEGAYCP